jgi:hypothetical protein
MIYSRRRVGMAAGSLAIGGAILAVALPAGASNTPAQAQTRGPTQEEPASSFSTSQTLQLLRPSFSLFRHPEIGRRRSARVAAGAAAGTSAGRRLAYSGTAGEVFVSAREGDLCVELAFGGPRPGIASGCAHAVTGAKLGAAVVLGTGSSMVLAAILPDGVSSITVERLGTTDRLGMTRTIPVSGNVAVYDGAPLSAWRFVDPSGVNHEEALTVPPA